MKKNNLLVLSLLSVASCSSAFAYDSTDDADVTQERHSADYQAQGLHMGSFNVFPKLEINNEYNSNIYKKDKNSAPGSVVDSYIAHFKPGVAIKSDWNRHALNLTFNSDLPQYATQGDQNDYEDLFTRLDGRLDVVRDSHLDTGFTYNSLHEDRGSPDQINGKGPTFFDTKGVDAFYTHKVNRMSVKAGLDTIRYDYQDVLTLANIPLAMSSRNRWEHMPAIRLGYEIQPEYEAFVKFVHKEAEYDGLVLSNGLGTAYNRNSSGYNVLGGLAFDLTDLITGDMSVGYLQRSYESAQFSDISGVNGFVNLKWRPTALTTVNGKLSHDINETTQAGVAGILATTLGLSAEHEVLRNVVVRAGGSFTNNDYQGFDATGLPANLKNRNDAVYGANVGAKYLLNRNFSTDLSYIYQSRDVNYAFSNYEVNQVMLNLRGQF
jgi:hypothetical protein